MSSASSSKSTPKPGALPAAKMPGEVVRGLVSLWLIIHLLGITLSLTTGTGMGRSELLARIKRAPILYQYISALWLDLPHAYRLTNGQFDGDYSVETDLVFADGHTETKPLQPKDARGERLERYQALAARAAPEIDAEAPDTTIAYHVGGAILKQLKDAGVKEVIFRVRRHTPLSMADVASSDPGQRDPRNPRTLTNLATISVTLNSSDQPQVQVKGQEARDVAPVTNPTPSHPNRKSGSAKEGASDQSGAGPSSKNRPPPPQPIKLQGDVPNFDSSKVISPSSTAPDSPKPSP